MPSAPACTFVLSGFTAWRATVAALLALVALVQVAWLLQAREVLPLPWLAAAGGAAGAALVAAASLTRIAPCRLRWDGERWHLGDPGDSGNELSGDLAIALDAGPWMLLHFRPPPPARHGRWLPVRQRTVDGDWHTLRCAVYSPRPAPGGSSAADAAPPTE